MIDRRALLKAILATPAGAWLRSWAPAPPGGRLSPDASAHYRRAFEGLRRLTDSDKALIQDWKGIPLDGPVSGLLRRASPLLAALRRGANAPSVCWGGEVVRVESLGLGPLDAMNLRIGKVALLRARALVESGRMEEALDDITAVAGFGRHLGQAGLLIARIFQLSVENEAIAALAEHLPRLDRSTLDAIPGRVASLPSTCPWAESMRLEGRFIASTVAAKIQAAGTPVGSESLMEAGLSMSAAEAVLDRTGGDRDRLLALVAEVVPCLADLAEVLRLPLPACGPALEAFRAGPEGINPFARSAVDHAEGLKYATERTGLLWSMLLAARTWIVDGRQAFQSIADPFGDGPFSVESRVGGFELRSGLWSEGRPPAVLVVGS